MPSQKQNLLQNANPHGGETKTQPKIIQKYIAKKLTARRSRVWPKKGAPPSRDIWVRCFCGNGELEGKSPNSTPCTSKLTILFALVIELKTLYISPTSFIHSFTSDMGRGGFGDPAKEEKLCDEPWSRAVHQLHRFETSRSSRTSIMELWLATEKTWKNEKMIPLPLWEPLWFLFVAQCFARQLQESPHWRIVCLK